MKRHARAVALVVCGVASLASCELRSPPPPELISLWPEQVPRFADSPVLLYGKHFVSRGHVGLDHDEPVSVDHSWRVAIDGQSFSGRRVRLLDSETLRFLVPGTISPGSHAISVVSPSGQTASGALRLRVTSDPIGSVVLTDGLTDAGATDAGAGAGGSGGSGGSGGTSGSGGSGGQTGIDGGAGGGLPGPPTGCDQSCASCGADECCQEPCAGGACPTCAAACSCALSCNGGTACDATCGPASTCWVSSVGTADSTLECDSATCVFSCLGAQTCDATCSGGANCELHSQYGGQSTGRCVGSSCRHDCVGETSCAIECESGADCELSCLDAGDCSLQCDDTSACRLTCERTGSCNVDCTAPVDCGGGVTACNQPCP